MIKSFISEREKHRYYNSLSEEQKYDAFNDILFESEHVVFLVLCQDLAQIKMRKISL